MRCRRSARRGSAQGAATARKTVAALRALATEGIQRGHMNLHARQVAIAAGAEGALVEKLAQRLVAEKTVRIDRAQEIFNEWKTGNPLEGDRSHD